MNVSLGIKTGDLFHSFEEIENKINESAKQNYVQLYKREARTIAAASHKTKRYLNHQLKYYQVEWTCVHGGRQFRSRSNGIRRSKTLIYKAPCPARIRIKVTSDGNKFVVINVENKHNHKVCKNLFNELPQQRKLPPEVREDTKKLLDIKVNRRMLRDELKRKLDKKITLKDLTNLQNENKAQYNNNIREACEKIKSKFGANSHILVDNSNVFKGMMFCTQTMKSAMATYPEFLCIDGTYKLLNISAPVYLILIENGNGESIIVAVGILICADRESVVWFLENFKKEHPNWIKIKTITTDKDLIERNVITECFPHVHLQIYIFHPLKIFQSEITCDKFKITSSEKHIVLEYLQKLVYSKNDTQFFYIVETMKSNISERVFRYLETNWISIKDEWYLGAQYNNFLHTTNNRIESINVKLKQVISKHSTIGEFLDKLLTILKSLENEQNSRLAKLLNKRSTILHTNDSADKYQNLVTPYSFIKMKEQLFLYKLCKVSYVSDDTFHCYNPVKSSTVYCTTNDSCSCYFHVSMHLPCKHIFAVRHYLNEDLYDEDLIPERWTMTYLHENNSLSIDIDYDIHYQPTNNLLEVKEKQKKTLSEQEKYRLLLTKCKMVASLGVEAEDENFSRVAGLLDEIINRLRNNIYNFQFTATTENCESDCLSKEITSEHFDAEYVECSIVYEEINLKNEMDCEIEHFNSGDEDESSIVDEKINLNNEMNCEIEHFNSEDEDESSIVDEEISLNNEMNSEIEHFNSRDEDESNIVGEEINLNNEMNCEIEHFTSENEEYYNVNEEGN